MELLVADTSRVSEKGVSFFPPKYLEVNAGREEELFALVEFYDRLGFFPLSSNNFLIHLENRFKRRGSR